MIEKWFVEMKFDNVRNAEIRKAESLAVAFHTVLTYPRLQKERICDSCRWAAEETLISAARNTPSRRFREFMYTVSKFKK